MIVVINIIYTITGTNRITTVLKVKADIITSMAASSIGGALIIMYVETFKADILVFIGIKVHSVT